REAKSLAGIVPLLETYLRAATPCLMYEFIEGGDLAGLIPEMRRRGGLTGDLATQIVRRLAFILAPAHQHGLVHRDLNPSNVLGGGGEGNELPFFVRDWGSGGRAGGRATGERASQRAAPAYTMPTAVRGAYTPLYASPQQINGEPADPGDDVH